MLSAKKQKRPRVKLICITDTPNHLLGLLSVKYVPINKKEGHNLEVFLSM